MTHKEESTEGTEKHESNLEPTDFISGSTYLQCIKMEQELTSLRAQNKAMYDKVESLLARNEELEMSHSEMEHRSEKLEAQNKELKEENNLLEFQIETAKDNIDEFTSQIDKLESENKELKEQLYCSTCGKTAHDPKAEICSNSFHLNPLQYTELQKVWQQNKAFREMLEYVIPYVQNWMSPETMKEISTLLNETKP